jgi:hypothetical protein
MISIGLSEGIIKKEDVIKNPETTLKNLQYFEPHLKHLAEEELDKIKDQATKIESVDIINFYSRVKKVYNAFLHREHYWKSEEIQKTKQVEESTVPLIIPSHSIKWVRA